MSGRNARPAAQPQPARVVYVVQEPEPVSCCDPRTSLIIAAGFHIAFSCWGLLLAVGAYTSNHSYYDAIPDSLLIARILIYALIIGTSIIMIIGAIIRSKWMCIICQVLAWVWTIAEITVSFLIHSMLTSASKEERIVMQVIHALLAILGEVIRTLLVYYFVKQVQFEERWARNAGRGRSESDV